jgi:histidinol-phosphate aminotransferase
VTERRGGLHDKVVPVALQLPSNAEYLKHLSTSGPDRLIRLASNENTDPPSPRVRAALQSAFDDLNLYPPPVPSLTRELARRHKVQTAQILITAGSTEVIEATMRTFVAAGDEVVLPTPSWPVYRRRLQALDARVTEVPLRAEAEAWDYDGRRFLETITPTTKLVIICSPNNPTGNAMARDDLAGIAATATPLLIDGAYCDFDPDVDPVSLVHEYPNVILTRTFSKAYSLAGLRLGYAISSAEMLAYIDRFLIPGSAVSSVALHAGLAALDDVLHYERQLERIARERERVRSELRDAGIPAWRSKGNFVCADGHALPGGAQGFAQALLTHGVLVRPLSNLVRITVGRESENDALIAAAAAVQDTRPSR